MFSQQHVLLINFLYTNLILYFIKSVTNSHCTQFIFTVTRSCFDVHREEQTCFVLGTSLVRNSMENWLF